MIRRGLLAAALLLLGPAAVASDKPGKVAITAASSDAAVLIAAPSLDARYQIVLARFDPATGTANSAWQQGNAVLSVEPGRPDTRFWVKRLQPGHYVVSQVFQQEKWSICFHAATVQFEIAAGQLLHLGRLDSGTALAQLQAAAVASEQKYAGTFQSFTYFDRIRPPRFDPVDAAGLAEAAAFVREAMQRTNVTLQPATLTPTHFAVTKVFTGEERCGGNLGKPAQAGSGAPG